MFCEVEGVVHKASDFIRSLLYLANLWSQICTDSSLLSLEVAVSALVRCSALLYLQRSEPSALSVGHPIIYLKIRWA